MKNKTKIISCTFFCCYLFNASATPVEHGIETTTLPSNILFVQTTRLNTNLPLLGGKYHLHQNHKKANSEVEIILVRKKKLPKINFLVLRTTKNTVLKAVLKRKSYGLRYTRKW